ncbi:Regulatory-associated protein of mTOR [Chelonia mydas]|uniref:Regulatory-associated protein of mTOR n=1 Tax=Chelonia mydas TaxID=8469 RepID=M7BN36_CHEMY|nr:Regulatory-associated protein of mTOR [Chelonia mydas]
MESEMLQSPLLGLGEEDESDLTDWNLPLAFMKKRHCEKIEGSKSLAQSWRMKDRTWGMSSLPAGSAGSNRSSGGRFIVSSLALSCTPAPREVRAESMGERQQLTHHGEDTTMKTVSVALVLCLNVGVDPPDVVKTTPCARLECWIDPLSMGPQKALETIGANLQKQYENWQPRVRRSRLPVAAVGCSRPMGAAGSSAGRGTYWPPLPAAPIALEQQNAASGSHDWVHKLFKL